MTTKPKRIAQTSREVKRDFKKNGPRLPEHELRRLERGAILDERAAKFREQEERRKQAKKKREEKERKEKLARKQLGVSLATQMIGFNHTQAQLKRGMEAFLGYKKRDEEEKKKREIELRKKLEDVVEQVEKEPWDDDDDDDDEELDTVLDLPGSIPLAEDHCFDDDLDDDMLLEAHDSIMSDAIEETMYQPSVSHHLALPQPSPPKEDPEFVRLHGPINKTVEKFLEKLPEPLIELLSHDISTNLPTWNPANALLHKLNPVGLPPHRLRIKVGCIVTLLRDLNVSSQLSKSSHLRVLRVENERIECMVVDGQLEGTKTFLTRVAFPTKHRNEDEFSFQRTQFPIRVAQEFVPSVLSRDTSQTSFKVPSIAGQPPRPTNSRKVFTRSTSGGNITNANPSFKLPGLPASKVVSTKKPQPPPREIENVPFVASCDGWDDFLESGTQIARELSAEAAAPCKQDVEKISTAEMMPPLSTQDFDFSLEDLDDFNDVFNDSLFQSSSRQHTFTNDPPAINSAQPASKASITLANPRGIPPKQPPRQNLKCSSPTPRGQPLSKRLSTPPSKPLFDPSGCKASATSRDYFGDFGISTQDVASFFDDDDELNLSSPPIEV